MTWELHLAACQSLKDKRQIVKSLKDRLHRRFEVSADLSHATVSVSIMGTEEEKATSLEGLASAARFLWAQLSQELRLRTSPELHFRLDRGLEHAQRIEQVLRELKGSGGDGGAGGDD